MADSILVGLCTLLLDGKKTLHDGAKWLAGVDWDDPALDAQTKQLLGRFELLTAGVVQRSRVYPAGIVDVRSIAASASVTTWVIPQ